MNETEVYYAGIIDILANADLRHRIPTTVQHLDPRTRTIIEDWKTT